MKWIQFILPLIGILVFKAEAQTPLRVGIAGLSHGHVGWVFSSAQRSDIRITGIVEPDRDLAERYSKQHNFSMSLVFNSLEELIQQAKPEAVMAFGPIYDHLHVVQVCAPRGIHVMVEKPLAVNLDHARKMESLARLHKIHLLTNYETTWYPSNHEVLSYVKKDSIGAIRKITVRDGHRGPKKIGVGAEFLSWLTDPKLNGGGAITDFGCYGANLVTWLMNGKRPQSVTAITQQQQPENNPNVDDDATIVLLYEQANAVIQASWNWPMGRKDLEVYGLTGAVYADNRHTFRYRKAIGYDGYREVIRTLPERQAPHHDPFLLMKAVVRNELQLPPYDLSSLENNLIVMEILEAAIQSARTGKTIKLD